MHHFPAALYICGTMGQLTVSLIISAVLLNIYHHRPDVPPPTWLCRLVDGCLTPLLCIRRRKRPKLKDTPNNRPHNPSPQIHPKTITLPRVRNRATRELNQQKYTHAHVTDKSEEDNNASIIDFNKSEWQNIARVLERLAFIAFTIFNTIFSVGLFTLLKQWLSYLNWHYTNPRIP